MRHILSYLISIQHIFFWAISFICHDKLFLIFYFLLSWHLEFLIYLFIYLFTYLFIYLFIRSFIYLFIYSFVCLFIYLFIYSIISPGQLGQGFESEMELDCLAIEYFTDADHVLQVSTYKRTIFMNCLIFVIIFSLSSHLGLLLSFFFPANSLTCLSDSCVRFKPIFVALLVLHF